MPERQPAKPVIWPRIWLVSDARNDAVLDRVLANLPRGSGLIFRHYHLPPAERRARFDWLARLARRRGHSVVLSGNAAMARKWRADGAYGPARMLAAGPASIRLVTAHSLREIAQARRARADVLVLGAVYATRSHPGRKPLGPLRFRLLAARAGVPVIALGGMNHRRAKHCAAAAWAAIDGLMR